MSSVRPYREIHRRHSGRSMSARCRSAVARRSPVQSMTNTPTADVEATIAQIRRLEVAGADIVRVSCPDEESSAALGKIVPEVTVPIVADIHFHYKRGIERPRNGAACCASIRAISARRRRVREVVAAAKGETAVRFRIGVKCGLAWNATLLEK